MAKRDTNQRMLNYWAIILIIWSIYRFNFPYQKDWIDEFIAKPLVFILPVYYYVRRYEKEDFFKALNWKIEAPFKDYALATLIGLVFLSTVIFSNLLKIGKIGFSVNNLNFAAIILTIGITLATSISEEILSRGFVLKRLYEKSKNMLTSSFLASVLFFFLHVPMFFTNAKIAGNMLVFFIAIDLILSLANSFIFLERKNLTVPILVHTFFNLTFYLFA